jgi:hypothetical protein
MGISSYGCYLLLIAGLGTLWLIVLCGEHGWFRNALAGWKAMNPVTRIVMAVLCAYCTVSAQKTASTEGGGSTNAPQATAQQESAGSRLPSSPNGTLTVTAEDGELSGTRVASAGPSRIVLQSTLASDPSAVPVFIGEPGWITPAVVSATPKLNALSFNGAGPDIPSPVCFTNATNAAVQTVVLAVRGNAADLATLVDAPVTARVRIAADGCPEPDMTAAERALTESLTPGQWQIAEVDLDRPASLPEVFFGGSSGRPEWLRNWRGEIAEVVGFSTTPGGDARAGVANYLAARWGFRGHPATPAQREAAVAAGLHYGLVWASVLIVK